MTVTETFEDRVLDLQCELGDRREANRLERARRTREEWRRTAPPEQAAASALLERAVLPAFSVFARAAGFGKEPAITPAGAGCCLWCAVDVETAGATLTFEMTLRVVVGASTSILARHELHTDPPRGPREFSAAEASDSWEFPTGTQSDEAIAAWVERWLLSTYQTFLAAH